MIYNISLIFSFSTQHLGPDPDPPYGGGRGADTTVRRVRGGAERRRRGAGRDAAGRHRPHLAGGRLRGRQQAGGYSVAELDEAVNRRVGT